MEELGRIDINIRESGGGGGGGIGSGAIGGGPSPRGGGGGAGGGAMPPAIPPQQQAALRALPVMSQRMAYLSTSSSAMGQLRDFMRSPSVTGYAELFKRGGDVRTMMAGMGARGAALMPLLMKAVLVVGVVVAAVGAVAAVFYALKKASDKVLETFERLYRYSPEMTLAKAEQNMARLMREMRVARAVGADTAQTVRSSIRADDAMARAYTEWSPILNGLARMYETMRMGFAWMITNAGKTMNFIGRLLQPVVDVFRPLGDMIGEIIEWLKKLFGIAEEDKRKPNVNEWVMSDIAAITGRPY